MSDVSILRWEGCYDSSWKGLITDASFAHPAKFSRGLIERIYDHCLAQGYLRRGDIVADVFGGIGTGGIVAAYRGLNWIGCELEPKFVALAQENFRLHRHGWSAVRGDNATIVQGDSRNFDTIVEAVVSSPPYAGGLGLGRGDPNHPICIQKGISNGATQYGDTPGQIETLKSGAVDSVISSPPFSSPGMQPCIGQGVRKDLAAAGKSPETNGKGHRLAGNIETLKEGTVQGVISSPPYSDIAAGAGGLNTKPAKKPWQQSGRKAESASQDTDQRYGTSAGQISQLRGGSMDACVSSPPFESSSHVNNTMMGQQPGKGIHSEVAAVRAKKDYIDPDSEGQIGKESGETYWQAVDAVYRSAFRCIRPGGVIVLVVKDYCAKGKRVRLCDDTMRLLEHIGFVPLERIHAMLVTETVENGLFGEERTKRQRKSFFRRLYEKDIPEGDERRIDHEEVLVARRP